MKLYNYIIYNIYTHIYIWLYMYRYIICAFSMIFGITLWPLLCCNALKRHVTRKVWVVPGVPGVPPSLHASYKTSSWWRAFLRRSPRWWTSAVETEEWMIRETSKKWTYAPCMEMYGIFTTIYPINGPNVGKYTIHGAYGMENLKILNDDPNDHKLRNAMENLRILIYDDSH